MQKYKDSFTQQVTESVIAALTEDIGDGDITANLIPENKQASAIIITREEMILCGRAWVEESFHQLDSKVKFNWHLKDGDRAIADQKLVTITGSVRALLTAERTAINFLQTLSATATTTNRYAAEIDKYETKILDTRKTIPGLRIAQKYAVSCGGGTNHRFGLYDAFLIKENHIAAAGSIAAAVASAHKLSSNRTTSQDAKVEVEVESIAELQQAIDAGSDIIMLDNFSLEMMKQAVEINSNRAQLEVSGNVEFSQLKDIAKQGIDFISIGALTKNINAIDLSMRII
ncbi:MAG: carboxylating nicotinate-nucleotide diphosphorylase [Thiotrichales bacterium]|jgi:nicotinate-nucleotide pyrophosphorylase (carboxylating)|nr:carboxylating nicotinate-nucleotide diphosphorylase [Thiotrichales bacterium]MBT3613771.1 carboxylating nicotinate-nucleotide diphosphorylase [Thiotrichales bacterium]MBT3753211.1 carboxylating nicotinate-nucleotide diphosphorylase [Thiotrichales bacterium]MBT3837884.1 carboxylating nicotinate-nucleotide diphosphorylase [Thiotrichales bacterium]MBT4152063.1 carboxylating nicotinate-nucleotide diphosphorylase [Thiotrichales bacterium]